MSFFKRMTLKASKVINDIEQFYKKHTHRIKIRKKMNNKYRKKENTVTAFKIMAFVTFKAIITFLYI